MTLIELKESLHKRIEDENNEQVLEQITAFFNHKDEVFIIPEEHLIGVKKGLEDSRNGRVHTQEDFDKKYEKWLKG